MSHDGSTAADIARPTRPSPVRTPRLGVWCTPQDGRSASNYIESLGLDSTESEPVRPSRLSDSCIGRSPCSCMSQSTRRSPSVSMI
jgi:hypothetical protein